MKNRLLSGLTPILVVFAVGACSVKTAVPEFEYPVYADDKEWPRLESTADLEQDADIDVEASIEEIDKLSRLAR